MHSNEMQPALVAQPTSGLFSRSPTNANVFMLRLHASTCLWHIQWVRLANYSNMQARKDCLRLDAGERDLLCGSRLTSFESTRFRDSSSRTLLRRNTHPGFTSGCATYTLNLERAGRHIDCLLTIATFTEDLRLPTQFRQVHYRCVHPIARPVEGIDRL